MERKGHSRRLYSTRTEPGRHRLLAPTSEKVRSTLRLPWQVRERWLVPLLRLLPGNCGTVVAIVRSAPQFTRFRIAADRYPHALAAETHPVGIVFGVGEAHFLEHRSGEATFGNLNGQLEGLRI